MCWVATAISSAIDLCSASVVVDSVMDSVTNFGSALTCADSGPERP
jgi:hypothetical protein